MLDEWRCWSCGQMRPDPKIDVVSYPIEGLPGSKKNYKYCNDKPECLANIETMRKEGRI